MCSVHTNKDNAFEQLRFTRKIFANRTLILYHSRKLYFLFTGKCQDREIPPQKQNCVSPTFYSTNLNTECNFFFQLKLISVKTCINVPAIKNCMKISIHLFTTFVHCPDDFDVNFIEIFILYSVFTLNLLKMAC